MEPKLPKLSPKIEESWTLPGSYYSDQVKYELGKEKYFVDSWQFIGDKNLVKVPGQVFPFTFLPGSIDEPLLLTRDTQDQIHLVSNVCTHRGMIVCEGAGNERFLRCRYHGRRFGLDGRFQHMPEFETVCNFPTETDHLKPFEIESWGHLLFTTLGEKYTFKEYFSPMIERLSWLPIQEFRHDPANSRDYMVRSHWALYIDNYLEGFHIPFIHASLNEVLSYDDYHTELFEHGNLQLAEGKSDDGIFDLPPSSPDFGKRISAYYYWFFPNMMFNFYPWGLSINVIKPVGIGLTKVSFIRYVWDESKIGEGAGAELDRVEREDEQVVELVQQGLKSRFYKAGRFSPRREIGTHQFHQMLENRLI